MDLKVVFARLGLGMHADAVYSILEANPEGMMVAHIARDTGLARQQVYRNLEELQQLKFVGTSALGKRTLYRAESAHRIEAAFKRGAAVVEKETEKRVKRQEQEAPQHIRFLKGFAGIRAVFDDTINHTPKGQTFYRYTSERDLAAVNQYLSPTYRVLRDKKKLERLVISNPASGRQKRSRLERFIKYIEPGAALFDQNIIQLVYGDKLAFINLDTEQAFIIEDPALAAFQKVIFQQLYRKL